MRSKDQIPSLLSGDPVEFAEQCLGLRLYEYQKQILREMYLADKPIYLIPVRFSRRWPLCWTEIMIEEDDME